MDGSLGASMDGFEVLEVVYLGCVYLFYILS